ncbi:hypothetical protein IOD16_27820 [Saccharothrix sp. 6-C]|uniref:hypothetical protein n=1 Tax=Saccharothrix sp. 6-C TaxID=2781735 RepID=UPI00191780B4|nr:hypothetical protein [Saccharothrix sp. 6-C]QQQ74907.1 hypothetical protein IOD16_27820 [Saccharothrix sp. 6-C]
MPDASNFPDATRLIQQLKDAGTLRIENPDETSRAAYRRAIHALKQRGLVPEGFLLRHTGRNGGDLIIQLVDAANPEETEWNRIRLGVRDQVAATPELTRMLRAHPDVMAVSESAMPRALGLVEGLSRAAGRRGYTLAMSKKRKHKELFIQVGARKFTVAVKEEYEEVAHTSQQGTASHKRYSWQRQPLVRESVPSGRLRLELVESHHARRSTWSDKGRARLENMLDQVVDEIEHRVAAEEEADRERRRALEEFDAQQRREAAEKLALWEQAMAQARVRATEERRAEIFSHALDSWLMADQVRAFCDALRERTEALPDSRDALSSWIDWGRSMADSIDPVRDPKGLTADEFDRTPTPDELRPYLGEWSPHRPEKEYRGPHAAPTPQVNADAYRHQTWHPGLRGRARWWQP